MCHQGERLSAEILWPIRSNAKREGMAFQHENKTCRFPDYEAPVEKKM